MSFEFVTKLPTPEEIRLQYPITEKIARVKAQRDQEIKDIFTGKSDRFLVIIGPCSADNEHSGWPGQTADADHRPLLRRQ